MIKNTLQWNIENLNNYDLQMNQISALNNPQRVDMPLKKLTTS